MAVLIEEAFVEIQLCLLVALGATLALIWPQVCAVIGSALIFGASFMAGPAAISVVAQRVLSLSSLTWGLALLTASLP